MAKTSKNKDPKKAAFLAAYASTGTVSEAARLAGIHRANHYNWLKGDPEYPEQFRQANLEACDALESEARRRALEGWEEPVYQGGVLVGYKRRYSDTMLAMLLNGNLPEKYRKQQVEHSGPDGGPIQHRAELIEEALDKIKDDPNYARARRTDVLGRLVESGTIGTNGHARSLGNGSPPSAD